LPPMCMRAGRSVVKSCILNTPLVAHPLSARSMALRLWHNVTILFCCAWRLAGRTAAPQPPQLSNPCRPVNGLTGPSVKRPAGGLLFLWSWLAILWLSLRCRSNNHHRLDTGLQLGTTKRERQARCTRIMHQSQLFGEGEGSQQSRRSGATIHKYRRKPRIKGMNGNRAASRPGRRLRRHAAPRRGRDPRAPPQP
jgi:hypothetical protein